MPKKLGSQLYRRIMSIGQRLKEEREKLGLSQIGMAEKASVSRATQQNYEYDLRSPDAEYLAKVAALGVDVQYVVTGERVNREG